ncbi:MAG TPA: FtsX-like permease family protein [Gemmatimonadaceae bacterium]
MPYVVRADVADQRLSASILGAFAALALVLALIGLYGVISYSVARRTRELGVRAALDARRGDLLGLVVRQGLYLVGAGLVVGGVAAMGLGAVMANQPYGVGPRDPATFVGVAVVTAVVATMATLVPGWRATRADPLAALREE